MAEQRCASKLIHKFAYILLANSIALDSNETSLPEQYKR